MNTNYKNRAVRSPYQPHPVHLMQEKSMDTLDEGNPIRQMLQRLCQPRLSLYATFSPDLGTMSALKTPGLVAVKCELSLQDGKPLGIGHGSTAISRLNKGLDRALYGCINGALMSAINAGCKTLDVIRLEDAYMQGAKSTEPVEAHRDSEGGEGITAKQKGLLTSLIFQQVGDEDERERRLQEVESCSRTDASELIKSFLTASQR